MTAIVDGAVELALAVGTFGVYTAVLLYLGFRGYRKSDGLRDYVVGSGLLNGWIVGISFGATYASANMFMGVPAMGYTHGTAALWWSSLGFGLPFLALVLFAKRFYRFSRLDASSDTTLPEWLGRRFQSPLLRIGAGLVSMFLVFYIMGQIIGAATLFERIFGLDYLVGAGLAVAIIAVYIASGGMQSAILTDFVQGVVMMGIALVTFASGFWVFGGLDFQSTIVSRLAAQDPSLVGTFSEGSITFGGPLEIVAISWLLFAFILMPHLMNRILVLGDELELRRFVLGSGLSLFVMSVFMIWAGLAGRVLFPDLQVADAVVPEYLALAFPDWAVILMVVGILSAILTTADSLLQAMASVVANDVYKHGYLEFVGGDADSERVDDVAVWVARGSVVVIALAALVGAAGRPDSLFLLTQVGITGLLSATAIPIILGYAWRGVSRRGAEAGFVVGLVVYVVLFVVPGVTESHFLALLAASAGNLLVTVLVSLVAPSTQLVVDRYDQVVSHESAD